MMTTSDLKSYLAYKDSGVKWLGNVPAHWEVRRLRNVADMRVSNVDKHVKDDEIPVRLCNYVDVYKIDMDSYRVEKRTMQRISLPDEDAEIDPVPTSDGGRRAEPELDRLSNIIRAFNDLFGDIAWQDADRVRELITETIPAKVAEDTAFKNARLNSDKQNARIEHDKALVRVMTSVMKDDTELFKQFMDNQSFKRWMSDAVFGLAYTHAGRE